MKPYLYFGGLRNLAKDIRGDETIHLGIRPYGFHAGNQMALVVYPYLLCKYLGAEGKEPKLKFIFSINDWEQDCLDGPDIRRYPFNVYPKNSSLQFMPDEMGCHESITDHWQPVIEKNVALLKGSYPEISIRFVRNSSLRDDPFFKSLLKLTIKEPSSLSEIFKKHSNKEVFDSPVRYAGAICKKCFRSRGETILVGENEIKWVCQNCGFSICDSFDKFDYWWYHKPLFLARIKILNIDIAISGGDHYSEGDFLIRRAVIDKFAPEVRKPKMLFTPTILALDGQKMSKSRNNTAYADIEKLIAFSDGNTQGEIKVDEDLLLDAENGNEHRGIFQSIRVRTDREYRTCN